MTRIDEKLEVWSYEQKMSFLESLMTNLPIAIRGIWSDESLNSETKISGMKWINELQHRVAAQAPDVRIKRPDWTGPDAGLSLDWYFDREPIVCGPIEAAVTGAIHFADNG